MEFRKAFAALNEQQQEAVTTVDGPVLVIAGPGTGKTELLSMRVANILRTSDTKPSNILCLTFTNKAAVNMKERIIEHAGPEGARVAASTFHSFAAEIMNLYPDYFWNAANLSVAPESVQLDIVESIVKELPLDNPLALKFAGQFTLLKDIRSAINLAKDAGLTPEKLKAIIKANLAYIDAIEPQLVDILAPRLSAKNLGELRTKIDKLPKQEIDEYIYPLTSLSSVILSSLDEAIAADEESGKTANTGRWKQRWVQTIAAKSGMFKECQRNEWWLNLAAVYEEYREAIHQRGFYDYADMLVEVIGQLEQNPEILADVQERFSYVLLDEFQDTNPAQLRLAHLVADHHASEGKPNLMVVGDDDQSIFKFNGAELNNMLGFKRTYPSAKIIILTKNYRSTQAILDTAAKIISQAETRLVNNEPGMSKDLVAESPPEEPGKVEAHAYSSRELQLSETARLIKKNYTPGKSAAVLARSHDSLIKMAGILQKLEVPVRYEQASDILEHQIVEQVYLLAKLLLAIQNGDRSTASGLIHQIIRHPLWGISPEELWQLAAQNYPDKDWLDSLLAIKVKKLNEIGHWFTWLAREAKSQALAVTLEQMLGLRKSGDFTSPLKEYFIDGNADKASQYFLGLSAIQLLRSLVHEFGVAGDPTLDELVRFIEINRDSGLVVADESPFITGSHAVQLLTVHKAKGLEFDQVYIIDAIEDNWQPRKGSRKPPANLPLQPVGDDIDDYIRLMYVAATRAKAGLNFSAYYQDHSGKDVAVSPIASSALEFKRADETGKEKLIDVLEENLRWPQLTTGQEREILKARLETYNLSVTHLLNFLDLAKGGPQYFKERNLLRLPELKSPNLSYGTAVHAAMEAGQRLANKGTFSLPPVEKEFSKILAEEQMGRGEFKRFERQGKQMLNKLFKDFNYELPKGSLAEQKFKDVKLEQAVIGGKLDRVDELKDSLRIIDYKTGAPLSSFDTRDKAKALKAHRQKIQLIFYSLLKSRQLGEGMVGQIEGQMVYVEADTPSELTRSYTPTRDDVVWLRSLIEAVWQRIMTLDLPDIAVYPPDISGVLAFEADLIKKTPGQ